MPHELVDSRTVYSGQFVKVRLDLVDRGGNRSESEVVEEGDGVLVVPVTQDQKIILIEQSRHLYGTTYEVPSGAINVGETPIEAAARELREEAGLTASKFELLSTHTNSVHMTGRNYYFMATGLEPCGDGVCDPDEEFISQKEANFPEIKKLIDDGRIPDIRNRGCLWLAQLHILQVTD
ncbi:MAG: NUDIX domain-containing protein [Erythrobacter sp.]